MPRRILLLLVLLTRSASAQPSPPDGPGFVRIFDGKTLDGWAGQDPSYWSVVDGAITGTITPQHQPPLNQYLVWQGGYVEDFELKLEFRLAGDHARGANSGFQFRSRRLPNGDR